MNMRLDSESIHAIARSVVELLREEPTSRPAGSDLTAGQVAERLGVSRDYVYAHADDLGARRLGDGPKARLRFDPARVEEYGRRQEPQPEPTPPPSKRRTRTNRTVELLPIADRTTRRAA